MLGEPGQGGASWLPDPTGRFQQRYWDGAAWTTAVITDGELRTDPGSLPEPDSARSLELSGGPDTAVRSVTGASTPDAALAALMRPPVRWGFEIVLPTPARLSPERDRPPVRSQVELISAAKASLKRSFTDVAEELEAQVWGAELDFAIAEAITVPPGDWRVKLKKIDPPPPPGRDPHIATNARIVHKLAKAISDPKRPSQMRARRVRKLLRDDCKYQPLNETAVSEDVASRLVSKPFLGSDPRAAGAWCARQARLPTPRQASPCDRVDVRPRWAGSSAPIRRLCRRTGCGARTFDRQR